MGPEFFVEERGITEETLAEFGVAFTERGVTFPYPTGNRHRVSSEGKRRFVWDKGVSASLFRDRSAVGTKVMFLVEGETDTMRLAQELGFRYTVLGLPGVDTWKDEWAQDFAHADKVYVILDNDQDYMVKSKVDGAYKKIRRALGPKARRVILPGDVKDLCEFFDKYDLATLQLLVKRTPAGSRFKPLDLDKEPGPVDWLVEGLICRGDVTLLAGDPGLGKSMLTMGLSKAVADGDPTFLNRPLRAHGRVLYVDEENPEDVILRRLKKFGLRTHANVRYLHRPGIWLDKEPESLLDEALDFRPQLIVLDSLSQIHTQDENSANAMSALFREAITPLARESGAAVLVIHHAKKSEGASAFQRVRGSGGISAAIDGGIDVRPGAEPGRFSLEVYKSRRAMAGGVMPVRIADVGDRVELQVYDPFEEDE